MAGRSHVDDSVIERRLRPIYEWLDTGNNKKAAQEADKVLRKQANLHCAKVLKGLALLRMNRRDECESLISSVIKDGPTDEATLQALTICFREMHQPDRICTVYEMAVKSDPSNEELLSHLFMAYVRIGDYKNQQQTAMKLYKLKPKNPYYFWAVMSHVMQAHKSADPNGKKISLLLAERMVSLFVKDGKIDAEAEVLTYLHILETQNKYAEALAVLDGPLAEKVIHQPQNFLALKRATYHSRLGQWESAAGVYKELISSEPDNWQHYVEYIRVMMELKLSAAGGGNDPLVEAAAFLKSHKEAMASETSRGPILGLLQLALVLQEKGMGDRTLELCGDFVELLHEYIRGYGDKMCCYGDIVNFLPLVPKERIGGFLDYIRGLVQLNEEGTPVNVEAVYRNLCWLQLRRALGEQENSSPAEHVQFSDMLVKLYKQTLHLSSHMADTDIRPGDAYLILAAHSYLKAVMKGGQTLNDVDPRQIILKAATVLEQGIDISKANFQLKLLLIKIYNMLGAIEASQSVYEKCDLKHIQLDTLGHVLALQSLDSGNYAITTEIISSTLKFFMANYKDTSDPLISSYKYGSLTRIPEFVDFRERLNNSLHFAIMTAEQMILDLTTEVSSHTELMEAVQQLDIDPATDKTNWEELCDNRDLRVMNTWEPLSRCLQESDIKASAEADIALLKLRNLTLRIMSAASRLGHSKDNNDQASANKENSSCINGESNPSSDAQLLSELTKRLGEEYEACSKYRNNRPNELPLQGPDPSRIYLYTSRSYVPVLVRHTHVLYQVRSCTQSSLGIDSCSVESLKEAREEIEDLISLHMQDLASLETSIPRVTPGVNPPALSHIHHLCQTLGLVAVLLGCCFVILKPIKTTITKKNKKRKEPVTMPEVIPQFMSYITSLTADLQRFEKALRDKYNDVKSAAEENLQKGYTSVDVATHLTGNEDARPICEKVEQSYVKSLGKLSSSISNKLKYVSTLKL